MDINATHFRTCDILQALARPTHEEHPLAHLMSDWDDEVPPEIGDEVPASDGAVAIVEGDDAPARTPS